MKKILSLFLVSILFFFPISSVVYGMGDNTNNPYTFEVEYTGDVIVNQTKDVDVELIGVSGPVYTNALITVDVDGPGTVSLLATDTSNVEHDIAETGFWGPSTRFSCWWRFYKHNTNKS